MGGTGGHVEGGRYEDQLCPVQGHQPRLLYEADIKADFDTYPAQAGLQDREITACGEGIALLKGNASRNVNVKEVDLAVPADLLAIFIENEAAVIEPAAIAFGERTADEDDMVLPGYGREGLPDLPAGFFLVLDKRMILILAGEHLRQADDLRAGFCSLSRHGGGRVKICLLILHYRHLDQSDRKLFHTPLPFSLSQVQQAGTLKCSSFTGSGYFFP